MPGNQTSIIVRFTNTSGSNGDPVCSWISISEQGLIPPNSKVENYTDQFNYGWYSWNDANAAVMTYELALPAGDYALATGIHEFWPQEGVDVNRLYTIDVTDGDGKVLATVNNTL
jgi:hypothetical protein